MVIFKSKQKKFEGDLKIKLCGKRLYPTESVKYLGVKIDTNLSWQYHVNDLSNKLMLDAYPTAVLSGLKIIPLFSKLQFYKKINFQ